MHSTPRLLHLIRFSLRCAINFFLSRLLLYFSFSLPAHWLLALSKVKKHYRTFIIFNLPKTRRSSLLFPPPSRIFSNTRSHDLHATKVKMGFPLMLILRAVQAVFAIIILGLAAYGMVSCIGLEVRT